MHTWLIRRCGGFCIPILSRPAAPNNNVLHRCFATTVALVTSDGKRYGPNVMACEWAMQVSYEPMLIAIFIHESPTLCNIRETGAFGVNIASDAQAELVNVAGGYSGAEIAKLSIPGLFETYEGKRVPMISGCVLAAECTVRSIQQVGGGDHVMVLGEVVSATCSEDKLPLIYTRASYRRLGPKLASGRKAVRLSPATFASLKKMASAGDQFVSKCAAAYLERGDGRVLFARLADSSSWMLPAVAVDRGTSYKDALAAHLSSSLGISSVQVQGIAKLERCILVPKGEDKPLRANFVVFRCRLLSNNSSIGDNERQGLKWLEPRRLPRGVILRGLLLPRGAAGK
jgi:flavin reductase (DIM6/NTAB) family NADH-FMN oxidoreductase RutF